MDPTKIHIPRYDRPVEADRAPEETASQKMILSPEVRSGLADEVKARAGADSLEKVSDDRTAKKRRPPPPKTPPPPPPLSGETRQLTRPDTEPYDFPAHIDPNKPPSSTTTTGKTVTTTTTPTSSSATVIAAKSGNLPSPAVDTTTRPADVPFVSYEDYEKKPLQMTPGFEKLQKESRLVRFDTLTQVRFFLSLGKEAKNLSAKHGISFAESAAIAAYTHNDFYRAINHQFRHLKLDKIDTTNPDALMNAGVDNPHLADLIAALISGMRKLPPVQVDESHFMALGRSVTMSDSELMTYAEGADIISPTFLSTTFSSNSMISEKGGFWNTKDNAMFIYQRVNGNARDIGAFSQYPDEKEILFLPNTKFKVLFRSGPVETQSGAKADELTEIEKKHVFDDKEPTWFSQLQEGFEQLKKKLLKTEDAHQSLDNLTKTFIVIQEIPHDNNPTINT